jgi:hypothetical protein
MRVDDHGVDNRLFGCVAMDDACFDLSPKGLEYVIICNCMGATGQSNSESGNRRDEFP